MVFAEREDVEPELVGEFDLLEQVLETLFRARRLAGYRIDADIGERVETEFHELRSVSNLR